MSYLPRFLPSLLLRTLVEQEPEKRPVPSLKYILIYNPTLVDKKAESDEALSPQILCFAARDDIKMDVAQQLNVLGLCQGAFALCNELSTQLGPTSGDRFIKTGHSVLVVTNLEPDFHMVICVDVEDSLSALVARQVGHVCRNFHLLYLLLHPRMATQLQNQGRNQVETALSSFWRSFLVFWNSNSGLNPLFPWSNATLFKGFLSTFAYYKRSSINLGAALENELDSILEVNREEDEAAPFGVLAALTGGPEDSSGLQQIKNYGVLYSNGLQKMTSVYQLLEWHEWNGGLTGERLQNDIFATKQGDDEVEQTIGADREGTNSIPLAAAGEATTGLGAQNTQTGPNETATDTSFDSYEISSMFKNTAYSTLEALHPASLTQNLVVLPLNSTVQGVRTFGETAQGWLSNPFAPDPQPLAENTANVAQRSNHSSQTSEAEEEEEEEEEGFFVVGELQGKVSRKNIFLEDKEYALVVFKYGPIVLALVYALNSKQLEEPEFYKDLARNFLQPAVEEIALQVNTKVRLADPSRAAGGLSSSIGSLKTLNSILSDQPDFFFIVLDPKEGTIRSSLPYLVGDSIKEHRNAVFYLHDMLMDVFVAQGSPGFFGAEVEDGTIAEFYHKFTGEKGSDWMLYYFRYHGKYIVVIRNHSIAKKRKKSTIPPPSVVAEASGRGLFNTITDGVSDYTRLGFVENLGEDVRQWLVGFSTSGET